MLLYRDIFTGKDILTDCYPMHLLEDFVYEVDAQYMTKCGDQFGDEMFGGNPSAEEQTEALDDPSSISGFDVILNHEDLEEWCEQPSRMKFVKTIMKKIVGFAKEKIPEDRFETVFKPKMTDFFKTGLGKTRFDNFQIFFSKEHLTEDGDVKAAPVFLDADDSGMKAKMYFFKDLMEEIKL